MITLGYVYKVEGGEARVTGKEAFRSAFVDFMEQDIPCFQYVDLFVKEISECLNV